MLKQKKPTPADLWKARKEKDEQEKEAYLPPGLINHGNTCFMNSVLQGLIATRSLYNLAHFSPLPHPVQAPSSRPILPQRSPQLTNGHDLGGEADHEWVDGMPLGDVFLRILSNAWSVQDDRKRERLSPKDLLAVLGRKYDQYLDFRQQDAHEFLRLLLDAMRMEELDIIKKRQPPPPKEKKRRSKSLCQNSPISTTVPEIDQTDKLESFVDMLFGGKLASFLVCEKCKHVSHTYEDFNDLSLSIKPEDFVKERKRDKFKSFAKKLGLRYAEDPHAALPRSSSVPPSPTSKSMDTVSDGIPLSLDPRRRSHELIPNITVSIGDSEGNAAPNATIDVKELEASVHVEFVEPDKVKREGDKEDDNWLNLKRLSKSVGMKTMVRSKSRGRSFKTGKSKLGDEDSIAIARSQTINDGDSTDTRPTPSPSPEPTVISDAPSPSRHSPLSRRPSPSARGGRTTPNKKNKSPPPPVLSREESAYLRHILADVAPASNHPFAIFRPAPNLAFTNGSSTPPTGHGLWTKLSQLPSVEECLRWFTSVEMLDGENMVGCRRCWKIANGFHKPVYTGQSESEDSEEGLSPALSDIPPLVPDSGASPLGAGFNSYSSSSPDLHSNPSPASISTFSLTEEPLLLRSGRDTSATSLPTTIDSTSTMQHALQPLALDETMLTPPASSTIPIPSTYGGIPIPSISTTEPESPMSPLSSSRTVVPGSVYDSSFVSLSAPKRSRGQPFRRKTDGNVYSSSDVSSDSFDDTESEASFSDTSSFASQVVSPNISQEQLHPLHPPGLTNGVSSRKPSTSKIPRSAQVIMRRCYKRYLISEPPPVLVIHLKRFQQTSKNLIVSFSTGFKKLDDFVTFPEQLDLTPFLAPKKEDFGLTKKKGKKLEHKGDKARCMYRLYAVVVHIGNMLGGHYVAYTALPSSGASSVASDPASEVSPQQCDSSRHKKHDTNTRQWAHISDTAVRLTTLEEVLKSKAYLCMYERIS